MQLLHGNAHRGAADAGGDRQHLHPPVGSGQAAEFPVIGQLPDLLQVQGDAVKAGRVAGQQGIADVQGRVQTNVGLQSSHSRSLAFWFADPVTA